MRTLSDFRYLVAATLLCGLTTIHADRIKIRQDGTNVMLGEKVLATLNAGAELDVVKRHGQWIGVRVDVDGEKKSGWLKADQVEIVAAPGMSFPGITANGAQQVPVPHMIAYVRAKGIDNLVMNAQQMVMQINPMFGGFINADLLGKPLGLQGLPGIDRKSPIAIVILNPDKFREGAVIVLPVTDFDALSNANQQQRMKIVRAGKLVCASSDAGAANLVAQAVQGIDGIDISSAKDDIEVHAQTDAILNAAGPRITQGIQAMTGLIMQAGAAGGSTNPQLTAGILKAEVEWLLELYKQTDEISFGISMSMNGLNLREAVKAKKGTELAKAFQGSPATDHKLARILPTGESLISMSGSVGSSWNSMYLDFSERVLSAMGLKDDTLLVTTKKILGSFTGDMAMSMDMTKDGLTMAYVMGNKGGDQFAADMRKGIDSFINGELAEKYKEMGMNFDVDYKSAVRTVDGVSIDRFSYRMLAPKGMENNPMFKQQMEIMKKVYGDPMVYEIAYHPEFMLMVMGKGTETRMGALIAQAKDAQKLEIPAGLKEAETALGAGGQMYGTFSLKQMVAAIEIGMSLAMPGVQPGPGMPIPGPPVTMMLKAHGNVGEATIAIPAKPIAMLQGYFMQKAMQMQQQKPQQQNQPGQQPQVF